MIATLLGTVLIEAGVVSGFSRIRNKPVWPLLLTSLWGNLITQSMLWFALNLFFHDYLITLFAVEILIWVGEGLLLYCISSNRLQPMEAALLSLAMNLSSFGLGWLLPL